MPLIFDIGFHNGNDTAHYLGRGFDVVAVEANPELARAGALRFADEIGAGRLTLLNVGLAEAAGELPFFVNESNSEWSSFDRDAGTRGGRFSTLFVPTVTIGELIARYGQPYYAKIDIEGNDWFCVRDMPSTPEFISVEAHRLEYLAALYSKGYRQFKIVNQREHGPDFPRGSSGPVSDTITDWDCLETVSYDWLHMRLGQNRRSSLKDGWYDFHAKLGGPELTTGVARQPLPFRSLHQGRHIVESVARRLGIVASRGLDPLRAIHTEQRDCIIVTDHEVRASREADIRAVRDGSVAPVQAPQG